MSAGSPAASRFLLASSSSRRKRKKRRKKWCPKLLAVFFCVWVLPEEFKEKETALVDNGSGMPLACIAGFGASHAVSLS